MLWRADPYWITGAYGAAVTRLESHQRRDRAYSVHCHYLQHGSEAKMNARAVFVVCFYLIGKSVTDAADADADAKCPDGPKSASLLLRRDLFCDYDANVRPAQYHTNATDVKVLLWLKYLLFHEDWNTLDVHSWSVWEWSDENLVWKKDKYDGIEKIQVSSSEIWVPDLAMWTGADMSNTSPGLRDTHCHLRFNGSVLCVAPIVHSALCNADITRWPFDSHNCSMRLGSWTNTGEEINLTMIDKGLVTSDYSPNRDWELLGSTAFLHKYEASNTTTHPWVSYSFNLKRHAGGHAATVFIPSLVLAVVTLTVFWTDLHSAERFWLTCVNAVCYCLYLQHLGANLPSNGDKYPIILLFFRDSLLLVGVSLCVTVSLRKMDAAASAPPAWITTVVDAVQATLPGRVLMNDGANNGANNGKHSGEDDVTELVETSSGDRRWHLLAVFLDRIFFLIFFVTFIILLCAFVP